MQLPQRPVQHPYRRGRLATLHDPDKDLSDHRRERQGRDRDLTLKERIPMTAVIKNALVSEEMAKKFATEKETPYTRFIRGEGLDIIGAHYVPSLHTVELKPWARR